MEIEQRLGLYQVFLKVYQYHRNLLDDILQLEKIDARTFSRRTTRYVTGICQDNQAYLLTNLIGGKTQTLFQPQGIWIMGRDPQLAISIPDRHLSRYHAAIQYIESEGFYLVDLNSTNGSFVNGEPIQGYHCLQDGDFVRLSSLAFYFFCCQGTQTLNELPPPLLAKLQSSTVDPTVVPLDKPQPSVSRRDLQKRLMSKPPKQGQDTSECLDAFAALEAAKIKSSIPQFSPVQQSEILDRFFSRQMHKVSKPD